MYIYKLLNILYNALQMRISIMAYKLKNKTALRIYSSGTYCLRLPIVLIGYCTSSVSNQVKRIYFMK